MDKTAELKRSKRIALSLLCCVTLVFIITLFLPSSLWVAACKAIAEAAMVGALADWFAVSALFHRIPVPFISRHTAIIPRNQARIADNLGQFIREKFLDTPSLLSLIRQHNPADWLANWLSAADNAALVARYVMQLMRGVIELADDTRIQRLIRRMVYQVIDKTDMARSGALLLQSLTRDNRHQVLLDMAIKKLLAFTDKPHTRQIIARQITQWLKRDHPLTAKLLPTEWLGEHSAELVAKAVNATLDEISQDQGHAFRQHINRIVNRFIDRLKTDPTMQQHLHRVKHRLREDEALHQYIGELWQEWRTWFRQDLHRKDSASGEQIKRAAQWLGETIKGDEALRIALNDHLETAVEVIAPDCADFLVRHISHTVKAWDTRDMTRHIEENIGKDLQFIRINGTLVGGTIGLILFCLSQLPRLFGS